MSLRSKMQILEDNANSENATDSDILKAALVETQNKYSELSAKLTMDIEALRLSVEQSNEQKATEIQEALKTASETILADLKAEIDGYKAEVSQATAELKKTRLEKEKTDTADNAKLLAIAATVIIVAFAIGGYIANLAWAKWYDIPAKVDAINNALYQLINR